MTVSDVPMKQQPYLLYAEDNCIEHPPPVVLFAKLEQHEGYDSIDGSDYSMPILTVMSLLGTPRPLVTPSLAAVWKVSGLEVMSARVHSLGNKEALSP